MRILLTFHQSYQPVLGNILASALVAGPLYVLFIMLAVLRLPTRLSALAAMLTAFVLAWEAARRALLGSWLRAHTTS